MKKTPVKKASKLGAVKPLKNATSTPKIVPLRRPIA